MSVTPACESRAGGSGKQGQQARFMLNLRFLRMIRGEYLIAFQEIEMPGRTNGIRATPPEIRWPRRRRGPWAARLFRRTASRPMNGTGSASNGALVPASPNLVPCDAVDLTHDVNLNRGGADLDDLVPLTTSAATCLHDNPCGMHDQVGNDAVARRPVTGLGRRDDRGDNYADEIQKTLERLGVGITPFSASPPHDRSSASLAENPCRGPAR